MANKPLFVWVNGICFGGVKAAAEEVSRLCGHTISGIWISRQLKKKSVVMIDGVTMSALSPDDAEIPAEPEPSAYTILTQEIEDEPDTEANTGSSPILALLRYPLGERPLDRGVCHAGG